MPKDEVKKDYRIIVFDLGNTLIRFDHNISAGKLARRFNLDLKKVYDAFFDSGLTRPFEKGITSPDEFHRKATEFLGIDMPFDEFVPIWNDIFWEDEGSCAIARRLKKTRRLFLLSNINTLHYEYIRGKFDILNIFDELILSFLVGSMKPEKAIFEEMLKRAGRDRERLLYIDDREDLVRESSAMGIDSIRYIDAKALEGELARRDIK